MPLPPIPADDLAEIFSATRPLWEEMRGQRLFVTGGTGFFGRWLTESFLHINRVLNLGAEITILTRDPEAFLDKLPHLRAESALTLLRGDVRNFDSPAGPFAYVIHAATEASARQLAEAPDEMQSTILAGTERVLAFARNAGSRKLLFTSSGAVYGPQPPDLAHIPEEFAGSGQTVYGAAKLAAEALCAAAATPSLEAKIARCFAFVGPHLPLDTHFAAGNFLRDALAGESIRIASDGSSLRSYLYATDLAIWLWTMLFRAPSSRPYNLGSEQVVTIRELAQTTANGVDPAVSVHIEQETVRVGPPARYVPSTGRARRELGLQQSVSLADGLKRTMAWHRLES